MSIIIEYLIKNRIYNNETTNVVFPYNKSILGTVFLREGIIKYELFDIGMPLKKNIFKIESLEVYKKIFYKNYFHRILTKYAKNISQS